jgi:hypothetical protein
LKVLAQKCSENTGDVGEFDVALDFRDCVARHHNHIARFEREIVFQIADLLDSLQIKDFNFRRFRINAAEHDDLRRLCRILEAACEQNRLQRRVSLVQIEFAG